MKLKTIALTLFSAYLCAGNEMHAQISVENFEQTKIQIFAGAGVKYHSKTAPYYTSHEQAYRNHLVFNLGISSNLWGGRNNYLGIDIVGYPYQYGDDAMKPKNFTTIYNVTYKRNFWVSKSIALFPAAGISVFSNDVVHMGTVYLDIGGNYDMNGYELYLKNSFRFAVPFVFDNAPCFLTTGCSINL